MSFDRREKLFIFFAMLSVLTVCGEYSITRPTSNALFLTLFSTKSYPLVWLFTVPLNFIVIYAYNRFLPKLGPLRILWIIAITTLVINGLSSLLYTKLPQLIFFQYAWKDIYILLMLKQIWSMIHTTVAGSKAKFLYGCIYGVGTIGAILGSLIPGFLATQFSSEKILILTLPAYLFLLFTYTMAFQRSKITENSFKQNLTADPRAKEAFSLIRRSSVLMGLLLLVVLMQTSSGLIEYRFNAYLELNILEKDLRTAYCGKLSSLIGLISLSLQFIGGFLMIRTIGLRASHFLVPTLLCSSAVLSMAFPTFAIVSFSYVFLKGIDFSLFGVIREMLYAPLQLDAKFRAKAIIDVFAYRTSKAIVSLGLIALQIIAGSYLLEITTYLSIAVFASWFATVAVLFRKREMALTN